MWAWIRAKSGSPRREQEMGLFSENSERDNKDFSKFGTVLVGEVNFNLSLKEKAFKYCWQTVWVEKIPLHLKEKAFKYCWQTVWIEKIPLQGNERDLRDEE
ncbi:hypothetical protein AVEN_35094-1 [Araneus ventricosus]|uniref:Uncharacterized protein n=1 Tax=Araneus ventricosus TaxID=182803 RepID=A0A4Y2I773_ARAVE|nr:hypothetical protein AVEN_35094-1 [Araneus ventricosus]